jgi:hypothetical protein
MFIGSVFFFYESSKITGISLFIGGRSGIFIVSVAVYWENMKPKFTTGVFREAITTRSTSQIIA